MTLCRTRKDNMKDTDKARIFKYMEWHDRKVIAGFVSPEHPLNATDMVAAMNKMVKKGDWITFFYKQENDLRLSLSILQCDFDEANFIAWLMQPERFFELMVRWLR